MTKDQELAALKTQVNALRGVLQSLYAYPDETDLLEVSELLDQTPQQCLAEYNEALINSMLVTCGDCNTLDFRDVWTIPDEKVDAFIEELKND